MTKTEKSLLDKAALAAFGALMAKSGDMPIDRCTVMAWQAADEFVKARYDRILNEHQGTRALQRILELDGNTGRCLDHIASLYAGKPDPLRAYAEDNIGHSKTAGQIAIKRFKLEEGGYDVHPGKETPLRLSPGTRKFLLEILEENSPEKLYERKYRENGEPLPEWLVEKIAEANKKGTVTGMDFVKDRSQGPLACDSAAL